MVVVVGAGIPYDRTTAWGGHHDRFWPTIFAYPRIVTQPRILAAPTTPPEAVADIDARLRLPRVVTGSAAPSRRYELLRVRDPFRHTVNERVP
jgi:hypothetical protein